MRYTDAGLELKQKLDKLFDTFGWSDDDATGQIPLTAGYAKWAYPLTNWVDPGAFEVMDPALKVRLQITTPEEYVRYFQDKRKTDIAIATKLMEKVTKLAQEYGTTANLEVKDKEVVIAVDMLTEHINNMNGITGSEIMNKEIAMRLMRIAKAIVGAGNAQQLELYINNDADLDRTMTLIIKNLMKKRTKGIYNHALAVKAFKNLVDAGVKKYKKEDYEDAVDFSAGDRRETAESLTEHFETEAELGNYDKYA